MATENEKWAPPKPGKDGWVQAAPGYWARGPWRVQRLTSGWRWWHVVQMPGYNRRGFAATLRDAKAIVEALDPTAAPPEK